MSNINKYKRLIIQQSIKDCREALSKHDPKKNLITLTNEQKEKFFDLGINFQAFLSNASIESKRVNLNMLANDYIKQPIATVNRVFFIMDYKGINKNVAFDMLNKIEKIADEQFGTLEDMDDNDKVIV